MTSKRFVGLKEMCPLLEQMKKFVETLCGWFFGCCLLLFSTAYLAYLFQCVWLWFVVPLGVPALSYVHAMGLEIFISCMMFKPELRDRTRAEAIYALKQQYTVPTLVFVCAWVVHMFMPVLP